MRNILMSILVGIRDYYKKYSLERMKKGGLQVGKNLVMMGGVYIDNSHYWHISIGDNVTLSARVYILAHDASTKRFLNYTRIGKVAIGNNVFVGAGTVILPGVTIGGNVVIGAGSIVPKDIPSNSVAAGNPARVICSIDDFLAKHKKQMETNPCFGEEYSLRQNVSNSMRQQMNEQMVNRIGYIV